MGLTLVRRLRIFSIFEQFACSVLLVLKLEEVSCSCHLTSVFASYDVPNIIGFLQGEYPSLGFPGEERAPFF